MSFFKVGRESGGFVNESGFFFLHRHTRGYVSPSVMSYSILPVLFQRVGCREAAEDRTQPWPAPGGNRRRAVPEMAPSTLHLPRAFHWAKACSSSGLGGHHPAVHEELRSLHPAPPQPLPNKTVLIDFHFIVMT